MRRNVSPSMYNIHVRRRTVQQVGFCISSARETQSGEVRIFPTVRGRGVWVVLPGILTRIILGVISHDRPSVLYGE